MEGGGVVNPFHQKYFFNKKSSFKQLQMTWNMKIIIKTIPIVTPPPLHHQFGAKIFETTTH